MSVPHLDLALISPLLAPVIALLVILAANLRGRIADGVALAGLVGGLGATGWLSVLLSRQGWPVRGTLCQSGHNLVSSTCGFTVSGLTLSLQAIVLLGALITLLLALGSTRERIAHHSLLLTAVAGALALAGARDLLTLVVSLETASLPVIALVALRRDARSAQAAVTLLLTSVVSLGIFVLGMGLVSLGIGSLNLPVIAAELASPGPDTSVPLVAAGIVVCLAGLGYKMSAVPFHLWTPDTYAGAPIPIAAFLAVVSKAAALTAVVMLLVIGAAPLAGSWSLAVAVLAAASMSVGNVMALRQQGAVRLLAWSTVAQAGWVLLPLAAIRFKPVPVDEASGATQTALAASVAYLAAYGAASLTAFAVVVLVARHARDAGELQLSSFRGLARREPVAAAALGLALMSLAGLPPGVAGLMAKVLALRPIVDSGSWWLAVIAVVNVAIGLAYYLRWTALLVSAPQEGQEVPTWRVSLGEGLALGLAAGLVVALSVYPQALAVLVPGLLG